jgi:uncharacterized protein Veg
MKKKMFLLLAAGTAMSGALAQDNVFNAVQASGQVRITQSKEIEDAMLSSILRSKYRKIKGYRVRIFFDNGQNARRQSSSVAATFTEMYPTVPVYLEFEDLYYKVAVGDFRTRTDAMRFVDVLQKTYRSVFIISENINVGTALTAEEALTPADSAILEENVIENINKSIN